KEFVAPKVPMPTKAEAEATLARALTEATKPTPDCARITDSKVQTALIVARPDAAFFQQSEPAFVAMAHCAEHEHAFIFMFKLGQNLVRANPKGGHPELVGRALLGL